MVIGAKEAMRWPDFAWMFILPVDLMNRLHRSGEQLTNTSEV